MLEKQIEKKVNDYAQSKGWLRYKFVSPNKRGVPDDIYMKNGRMFFIEFKQEGKRPTKLQEKEHVRIGQAGFYVYIVDSVEHGKRVIDAEDNNE